MKHLIFISLLFLTINHTTAQIFVDINATGSNNGSSWANAYTDLQDGIDAAMSAGAGTQVWVAAGTYLPTNTPSITIINNRDKTFHFNIDIQIYGGFSGTETMLSQRNATTNLTILSGDLGIPNDSTDNAYHVLITRANNTVTLIDGFTIKDGNADGNGSISYSGIFFSQAVGGGIYNKLSSLTLTNVTFSNNSAVSGGGLFNDINTYSRLTNVTFSNNSAVSRGGGIYNNKITYSWLANVTFSNNSANDGGGIYNDDSNIYPRLINVTFSNNLANWGGGMYNFGVSNPRLTNVTFSNNSALTLGGGMYNYVTAIPKLNNTVFYKNIAFNGVDIGGNNINASSSHNASDGTGGNISAGTGFVNLFLSASPFQNSTDPAGVDNTWFTTDDGLALLSGSPLLGAGTTNNAPIKDITGTTRPNPPSIGAYELVEPVSTSTIFETAISTFPNPTTGIVQIDLGKRYEEVHLSINNVIGKRINSTIYNHQNTIQLDLSNYPKGVYFINIQSDDKRVVLKLLLE